VARCAAYIGLAYAAGFLMFMAPGGIGVRDFVLQRLLARDLGRALGPAPAAAAAVVAVLAIRLLWTVLDVAAGAVWFALPVRKAVGGDDAKCRGAKGE
jgi:uncharacterized membrane protein YbhN (UPF0104 family)